jgi:zinc transporter, ZIP family
MLPALGWGALAASSLLVGVALALARSWQDRTIGLVLSFGAGALISAVAFELFEEGTREAGEELPVALGLAAGALTYFVCDRKIERRGESGGLPLALGALLDGIPEQAVLGIGLAGGQGVSVALLVAIFVSNLPEGIGSASDMLRSGWSRGRVVGLWSVVSLICLLATVVGYAVTDAVSGNLTGAIDGFAAGALLVMLSDSMIPESRAKAGLPSGLVLVLGFAVAAGLSAAS